MSRTTTTSRMLSHVGRVIDPAFRWGETKEKRAFEDRHASTQAYIDYMRPRCVELSRVLKKTGSTRKVGIAHLSDVRVRGKQRCWTVPTLRD